MKKKLLFMVSLSFSIMPMGITQLQKQLSDLQTQLMQLQLALTFMTPPPNVKQSFDNAQNKYNALKVTTDKNNKLLKSFLININNQIKTNRIVSAGREGVQFWEKALNDQMVQIIDFAWSVASLNLYFSIPNMSSQILLFISLPQTSIQQREAVNVLKPQLEQFFKTCADYFNTMGDQFDQFQQQYGKTLNSAEFYALSNQLRSMSRVTHNIGVGCRIARYAFNPQNHEDFYNNAAGYLNFIKTNAQAWIDSFKSELNTAVTNVDNKKQQESALREALTDWNGLKNALGSFGLALAIYTPLLLGDLLSERKIVIMQHEELLPIAIQAMKDIQTTVASAEQVVKNKAMGNMVIIENYTLKNFINDIKYDLDQFQSQLRLVSWFKSFIKLP